MDFVNNIKAKVNAIPHHMDFEGQKLAEKLFQIIIIIFAIVGYIWGYACQQLSQSIYILGAGFALCCLLVLPPWPFYRRKPLVWQKHVGDSSSKTDSDKKEKSAPKKEKKSVKKDK